MTAIRTTGLVCKIAVFVLAAVSLLQQAELPTVVDAFATHDRYSNAANANQNRNIPATARSSTRLFEALPEGYREFGEKAILQAAQQCGMNFDEENGNENGNRLDIQWKAGTILVTVHGEVSLREISSDDEDNDADDVEETEEEEDMPFGDAGDEEVVDDDSEEDEKEEIEEEFSLTLVARTINKILDDDGIGLRIAEAHSIEVTTPGVDDLLVPGTPQFEAFMGFEVIVEHLDPKKKNSKVKIIEGRLYERNDEFTIINIKGRMKKMKNETVLSVRLPKAKKEKGGR